MALSTIAHHNGAALCLHLSVHSYAQSWICVHAYPNRTALRASPLVHTSIAHRPSALHVLRECFDPQPRSRTSRQAIRQLMVLLYACGRARVRQCRIGAPGQANNTQRVRVQVAGACEGNRGTPAQLWFLQGPQPATKPHIPWCCCAPRGLMTLKTPPARIAKFLAVAAGLPTPCPSAAPLAEPTDPSYTSGSPTSTRVSPRVPLVGVVADADNFPIRTEALLWLLPQHSRQPPAALHASALDHQQLWLSVWLAINPHGELESCCLLLHVLI